MKHFWIIYLSTDAERICTPDIISVPQIVAEYGETVILNCTNPSDDYQDLTLKTETEIIQNDFNYFEVPVTKWDMKVELVIQLDDSLEHKREVEILVYSKSRFKWWPSQLS